MKLIKNQGFTNKTYYDEEKNQFIKIKNYDTFNHKTPNIIFNALDFVPKTIYEDETKVVNEWIDGPIMSPQTLTDEKLKEIGKKLITLHNSKLEFYKENQIARRFKVYREKIKEYGKKIPLLDKHYKKINLFLKNIDNSAPVHNDLWLFNFIESKNGLYITDWEYATMGDVHFDLAYFIESSELDARQEQIFLEAYGDDFEPKFLLAHKIIVNALIVLWINKHEINPFDDSHYLKRVDQLINEYNKQYNS
ncbi:Phosphotransferase system PTS,lichenan-specific IIa component [Metamycoplasma auris 15026]|uniref:Phosphotransferase system PTS,lichenan-specific IIa component n=1 Tax=Metamycoplasma auris 15026 TaxID=1188233 RepID=N9TR27_9BACT|nr:phosphotransferase [Metamycoplasma auris]ENY68530.1 Phosphotransferase system PTS,lichenan-specific IIa component [Metamycoplasma auris 15026]